MPDRLPSDHPSIETHRVRVGRRIRRRCRLDVPPHVIPVDEVVRVIVDEQTCFATAEAMPGRDSHAVNGTYESPSAARDPGGGVDRLSAWLRREDIAEGSSVLLDVIEPGVAYGIRQPGERAVYAAVEPTSSSLQDIARRLGDSDA